MKKTTRILFALAALLVLGACSAEPGVQHEFDETKYFQKITAKMSLEHGYLRLDYTLGVPDQTMTFLLKNQDVAVISVDEWYMNETDNIRLYDGLLMSDNILKEYADIEHTGENGKTAKSINR